jgi:hypothetical protein
MQKEPADVCTHEGISDLVKGTVARRDVINPEGRRVWVPMPPSPETLQMIRACGATAVPALTEYSRSGSYHERELAIEFLSFIGGAHVAESLQTIARNDPEPSLRKDALKYLAKESWELAGPVVKEVPRSDPDRSVREYATYLAEGQEARAMQSPSQTMVRSRISALMRHIIKEAESVTPDGLRIRTVARPTVEDIKEVEGYGDDAVPILSGYLTSQDGLEKDLAIRFLGILGGARIVGPLGAVVRTDASPGAREMALRWLAEAPWDMALPIIQDAARNDPDSMVRQAAQELPDSRGPGVRRVGLRRDPL